MPKSPKSAAPRSNLTLEQHWQIIQYKKEHPTLSTAEIARVFAEKFNHPTLNQSTVSRTLNKEERLRPFSTHTTRKKISQVRCPEVEEALMKWYSSEVERGNTITGPMLRSQAIKIADDMGIPEDARPKYSNGWLDCYKSRHQLKFGNRPQQQQRSIPPASSRPGSSLLNNTFVPPTPVAATPIQQRSMTPPSVLSGNYYSPRIAQLESRWESEERSTGTIATPATFKHEIESDQDGDDASSCCSYSASEDEIARAVKSLRLHLESCPNLEPSRANLLANMAVIECAVSDCKSPTPPETRSPISDSIRSPISDIRSPISDTRSTSRSPVSPISESAPSPSESNVSLPPYRRQRWLDLVTSPMESYSRQH